MWPRPQGRGHTPDRAGLTAAGAQGSGLGGQLVQRLVEMARARGVRQVCALTLVPGFFARQGFARVDRWSISPKIWGECVYCPKFHACDEIAVLRVVGE